MVFRSKVVAQGFKSLHHDITTNALCIHSSRGKNEKMKKEEKMKNIQKTTNGYINTSRDENL